jgi:hypothetical protein
MDYLRAGVRERGPSRWVGFDRESGAWNVGSVCVGWQFMTVKEAAQRLGYHRSWRCRTRTQCRAAIRDDSTSVSADLVSLLPIRCRRSRFELFAFQRTAVRRLAESSKDRIAALSSHHELTRVDRIKADRACSARR